MSKHARRDLAVPAGETLAPVPGAGDAYLACSDGHIYCVSNARVNARKPTPFRMAESISTAGYPFVSLRIQGKRKSASVHGLVCRAFHGEKPTPRHEVRHLDGTRTNSRPENLSWGTPAENEADKRRRGTAAIGERHGIAKLNDEAVRILRASIPRGLWNPVDAAAVFGVDPSVIRAAVSGKNWSHVA